MKDFLPNDADEFLSFPPGTFDHIPHYAVSDALSALEKVRNMEKNNLFRPGLYYIVLSDLCRATEAANVLGNETSKKRIETFILTCVESLGYIDVRNYHLFLREIGDAVLIIFSSFEDAFIWWETMNSNLLFRNRMWTTEIHLNKKEQKHFKLECKTVIHAGEIDYSGKNIPLSNSVNQIFKIEKEFKPNELGITDIVEKCAKPLFRKLKIYPRPRSEIILPGDVINTKLFIADNYLLRIKRMFKNK